VQYHHQSKADEVLGRLSLPAGVVFHTNFQCSDNELRQTRQHVPRCKVVMCYR
jgi:hypothetical protein